MPPRTRASKSSKSLKENIGVSSKAKQKAAGKVAKHARKVLGDKTNSASDDNTSVEAITKPVKEPLADVKSTRLQKENDNHVRPRRDRRLPNRFVENQLLNNLSKSTEKCPVDSLSKPNKTLTPARTETAAISQSPLKNDIGLSTFKTPQNVSESSLVTSRPKRVRRLPSKFEDHSISPNKFIPVQPFHASTPLVTKNTRTISDQTEEINHSPINISNKSTPKTTQVISIKEKAAKAANNEKEKGIKKDSQKNSKKLSPDNNNNAKVRTLRTRKVVDIKTIVSTSKESVVVQSPVKKGTKKVASKKAIPSPVKKAQKPNNKSYSFKILEDNNKNERNEDVYEFTYDPNEEPPPQKKKKRAVKRKPAKPKTVVFKNNYDTNVNKAIAALKNVVAKKQVKIAEPPEIVITVPTESLKVTTIPPKQPIGTNKKVDKAIPQIQRNIASKIIISNGATLQQNRNNYNELQSKQQNVTLNLENIPGPSSDVTNNTSAKITQPNRSFGIEDIEADFEPSFHDDLNYSPVNSPRPVTPTGPQKQSLKVVNINDPLNLRESFFNEPPIASSSINVSARHPGASPWRVEFENLPIRWHVNSYTKANMTPAMECSFVNFDEKNKKKHVYTNILPDNHEPLPEIVEKSAPNMIQSSIISFIREVMEKSSSKKKRARSVTPATPNLFTDITNKTPTKTSIKNTVCENSKATRQLFTPQKQQATIDDTSKDTSDDKESSKESSIGQKRKRHDDPNELPAKTPCKEKDKTFFGFDESENLDQENFSPSKKVAGRKRPLRSRARAVLKEINDQGPTRAAIPIAAKPQLAEVERLYDAMQAASDAPVVPEKEPVSLGTNVAEPVIEETSNEDDESVHLFEDVEVVHHVKAQRKSYGKAKKVAFCNKNTSESDSSEPRVGCNNSDAEDDLDDPTFDLAVPFIEEKKTKKKTNKKQKMTKKEKQEADAWAAGFNSMCEDVEGFDLVVE